jgi:hypothetical protein
LSANVPMYCDNPRFLRNAASSTIPFLAKAGTEMPTESQPPELTVHP